MWVTDILIIIPVVSNPLCDLIHICGSLSTCKKRPLLCMYWHLQLARWPANLSHEGDVQVELADVDHKLRSIYCNSGPKSVLYLRRWHCFDSFQIDRIDIPNSHASMQRVAEIVFSTWSEGFEWDDWFRVILFVAIDDSFPNLQAGMQRTEAV